MVSEPDEAPEPRDDESDAEFRARFRLWFDSVGGGNETIGWKRSQWLYIMSLHGIDPGDDFAE